jgi:hypothetical protein
MIRFFNNRKSRKYKNHDVRLILPKSMICVVKKYSMNGCEMSSLILGHFNFIKWYLKEKDQEKTKPNWKNFGKKRMTNSHFLASSPSILKRFLASPLHHM